ncbi:MAG TPA: M14 family metallopeptidase, partial [Flavisolibacter sp.]
MRGFFLVVWLFTCLAGNAQLQSPEQFLGYRIGTRFTPHWKITEYFRHVASVSPTTVKLQPYGETNEGRPLLVAIVSAAGHIGNLENVRLNNLRLAAAAGNDRGNAQAPAIVWLSYNVHGNEASSSEVSMLTLHALADPSNAKARGWLQNTVVIIDPCLNPDGRDRYVNWYNSVAGATYNPLLAAREHQEPWPGGRSNHYYHDLNRDWAWQTQVESQQRVRLYHEWLPQVHVDFHEQYINDPYYFAPAAEPYHEVITPWQRNFQTTIGRNHARYFDAQGWLYFTKQYFDLLYPSYGDTYPIFNGSIGMTYEQAGHGLAGLGVVTEAGDTLTLTDRVQHHFTTSLSTVEVASSNATQLVSEFKKYFTDAVTEGAGIYKSYVIRYQEADAPRIRKLLSLLQRNKINYAMARSGSAKGYDYHTGREENFTITDRDIIVPAVQPKSAMVKVLFEPKVTLADSLTYDITAWSLPYAYGLRAFATTQRLPAGNEVSLVTVSNPATEPYAYVVRWDDVKSVRLAGRLMQKGIRLRFSQEPFESGGQVFGRGSMIILKTGNQYVPELWSTVRNLANQDQVQLYPVSSGFVDRGYDFGSNRIRPLKNKKVAVITGPGVSSTGAGEVWHFFDKEINYPVTLLNSDNLAGVRWGDFDVVILPSGNYRFLNDKASLEQFRSWINGGGQVIAIESAVAQLARLDFGLRAKREEDADTSDLYA